MAETSHRREDGFTLIEVLIVVTLMGVVALAIGSVFSVVVRTLPSTEARADDARSLLGLSTWLPGDVNSTPHIPMSEVDTDGAAFDRRDVASGCSTGNEGINLLKLAWSEEYGPKVDYSVSYRFVERTSGWHIVRVSCVTGAPGAVLNMTSALPSPDDNPVAVSYRSDNGTAVGVVFRVTTIDGGQLRIDTASQNPNETLPPLGSVNVDPPPFIDDDDGDTTPPPEPPETSPDGVCSLLSGAGTVVNVPTPTTTPMLRDASTGDNGKLMSDEPVSARIRFAVNEPLTTFPVGGAFCSTLTLSYDTGTASLVAPMFVEASCVSEPTPPDGNCAEIEATATVTLPGHWSQAWTDGLHPISLLGPAATLIAGSETQFQVAYDPSTVPVTCTASFLSVVPNPVHNTNNANSNNTNKVIAGPLLEPVKVTVSKGENCGNLGLEYLHDPPASKGWKPFGASSEVILERNNQETWSDGPRVLRLRDGQTGAVLAETTLTIL